MISPAAQDEGAPRPTPSRGARLLSVRLQGFKSFAARTTIEFEPGISAVVGPNGAGKSNLADALRWALGEQGRALRSRRSEDVIFAGSEAKPALGMADVTVVIDNSDGLLPVEYGVVELGRRIFRSGEGEYLLNATRVRLRDLEDLLEAAHLADNAFLFIGQGMVDQALALRPGERRPLFEEVAGVRRHERRRRAAEAQLLEAEGNLERVRDIIAELRPRARRLAGQAEQQAARGAAARALAEAIVAHGRGRWFETAGRLATASEERGGAQAALDAAIAELRTADDEALELSEGLERRLAAGRAAREALDEARSALHEARLEEARVQAQRTALGRERQRLTAEQTAIEGRIVAARRRLALPLPGPDVALEKLRRTSAAVGGASASEAVAKQALDEATAALAQAAAAVEEAERVVDTARRKLAEVVGQLRVADEILAAARARAAHLARQAAELAERLPVGGDKSRPDGSGALIEGLATDPYLRRAVEAALGPAARGALVERRAAAALAGATDRRPASLVLRDLGYRPPPPGEGSANIAQAIGAGGGRLAEAVRADPSRLVRRLLERALWVPDLEAALSQCEALPPGWVIATPAGEAVHATGVLVPAATSSTLELRDEHASVMSELAAADHAVRDGEQRLAALDADLKDARSLAMEAERVAAQRQAEQRARRQAQSAAERAHELAAREAAWWRAHPEPRSSRAEPSRAGSPTVAERERIEGSLAAELQRSAEIDRELERLASADAEVTLSLDRYATLLAEWNTRVAEGKELVRSTDLDEGELRGRLGAAERAGHSARERLRHAEGRLRAVEVEELEARVALETAREQILVELAALGGIGRAALGVSEAAAAQEDEEAGASLLEAALDAVTPEWTAAASAARPRPSPDEIAALRRRYHQLGVVNPFAVQEHAEISARLETLEGQRDDLERAIGATRRLIADLEGAISEQFQATFRALESAFDERFRQLFGGGHARLALTDPDDAAASGVEIVARPPGKKAQPLSMLSGGERALTAVALLFAMLEVRPVPFCVLDEVDAALDEANIGRFAEALRELAASIQFIVITHNRGTIEEADALHGVTIGDDAVSRVVSLRLGAAPARGAPSSGRPSRGRG